MIIVYTRFDGGVSVCNPAPECLSWMSSGGVWNDRPRGYLDVQVQRMIEAGHDPDASLRFAKAIQFGGCTTAEALKIIRDRDCGHLGTAHELWNSSDVPADRWFRNAWRRSHNGGPISIDLALAKPIQFRRAKFAVKDENNKRDLNMQNPVEVDWRAFQQKVLAAREERELRQIWPL